MFKIVQRGSEHGSDQEQPYPSKRLQGSTQQGSDSGKKDSGHERQKLTSTEQIKKSSPQSSYYNTSIKFFYVSAVICFRIPTDGGFNSINWRWTWIARLD